MRRFAFFGFFFFGVACGSSPAQTDASAPVAAMSTNTVTPPIEVDPWAEITAKIPTLHQAWMLEHDPAKRRDFAGQLVEAVIHEYDKAQFDIVDEVARDGAPKNEITSPAPARNVALDPLTVFAEANANPDKYPQSPVFRRITANRVEAWTPKEGRLFDGKGKMLADVHVPRRDGTGREWFGAFLPDGTWITTDLWDNDKQLNCFSSTGQWKWELPGKKILSQLPKPKPGPDALDEPITPSIGWARVDKTGHRWLLGLGLDWTRGFAFVTPSGQVQPVPDNVRLWSEVYPRAMDVRGYYIALYIDSDDGKVTLNRGEAGHGVEVGWPRYDLANRWTVIIPQGDDQFGFWPRSHQVYIEGFQSGPEPWHLPHRVWFFSAEGKYQGEVIGSRLGDAANGQDLLIQDANDRVVQVQSKEASLAIHDVRRFTWPNGTTAVPVAIYDDLKLGFFLRGPGIEGFTDDARRARASAEVVLARWKD